MIIFLLNCKHVFPHHLFLYLLIYRKPFISFFTGTIRFSWNDQVLLIINLYEKDVVFWKFLAVMIVKNFFCGMVDQRMVFSLISNRDHCQRISPSRISNTPRAGFISVQNVGSVFVESSCAVKIITTSHSFWLIFCIICINFTLSSINIFLSKIKTSPETGQYLKIVFT